MNVRSTLGSIFASAAIIGIGWQFGAAAATSFSADAAGASTSGASAGATRTGGTAIPGASVPAGAPTSTAAGTPSGAAAGSTAGPVSGTFLGSAEPTRFGDVQVQIVVSAGRITEVTALHLTDRDGRSVEISNEAAPILRSEVLASQSSTVNGVSGATYTTDGYLSSVQSAIDKAGL